MKVKANCETKMRINGHTVTTTKRTTGEYGLHFDNQFAGDFPSKSAAKQAGRQMAGRRDCGIDSGEIE